MEIFNTHRDRFQRAVARFFVGNIGRLLFRITFKIKFEGRENLPASGPLIIISNHYSWFEAPLLIAFMPYGPSFIAAVEMRRFWWFRAGEYAYDLITIWRGQVDRKAIHHASALLEKGRAVGIFPEGGVNPQLQDAVARGERIESAQGHLVRTPLKLARARPGAAFLAVRHDVPILPVAVMGADQTLVNLKHRKRTPLTIRIGQPFGPLTINPALKGQARRECLDALGDEMMLHLARLFPIEQQGYYQGKV